MNDPATRYETLMRRLLEGRARGAFEPDTPGEDDEDALLEAMDACWWKMSADERALVEQRLDESRRIVAPETLETVDVEVDDGAHTIPRRAA